MPATPDHDPPRETLVYESDWLASRPFFYSFKNGRASHNVNEVIDLADLELDAEGLNDYLDYGFCVFERTPVRDVRLLRYSSRLLRGPGGLRVQYLDDPALPWLERRSTVDEVLEVASARINAAAAGDGPVVVPTSGGLDSRLLNLLVSDRKRVRAFTFGVSDDPRRSLEAVRARELARRLGIRWDLVPVRDFHRYLDEWDALYGICTHAAGMYQIAFYRRVLEKVAPGSPVLSGSCGDWFAGGGSEILSAITVHDPGDVLALLLAFPCVRADSRQSRFGSWRLGGWRLLDGEPRLRREALPRVVAAVRLRVALLSSLVAAPESLGLAARAPYADIDLAMRMVTLPTALRVNRRWQRELFARWGVDLESAHLPADGRSTLNYQALRCVPLQPLDVSLLSEVVKPDYVRWINRHVGALGLPSEALWRLSFAPGLSRAQAAKTLRRSGLASSRGRAYCAYLTLKPLEALLLRRERARRATAAGGLAAERPPATWNSVRAGATNQRRGRGLPTTSIWNRVSWSAAATDRSR